jgi:hypothetical protein
MRQSVSRDLYEYWNRLRGARSAPDRADIEPAAIRHVLADSFIIEIDEEGAFPIRLCGTRLSALLLEEMKGRSFLDMWREEDRRNVAAAILTVLDGATPVVAGARAPHPIGSGLDLELLLLPLRHFGRTHARILGALSPAYVPDWLGRTPAEPLCFTSMRVIRPGGERSEPRSENAAAAARFGRRGAPPKLIVYQGGKM